MTRFTLQKSPYFWSLIQKTETALVALYLSGCKNNLTQYSQKVLHFLSAFGVYNQSCLCTLTPAC